MKLLIITQKIDKEDPVLGFFHEWVLRLSSNFEKVSVICLEKGEYNLPKNVSIYSLGKVSGSVSESLVGGLKSKIKYVLNFYKILGSISGEYDRVFVHMNQEYILLAGLYWTLKSKKVFFWRNHPMGGFLTRVSVFFSHSVFCTSPEAYTARFNKTKLMPVGIDIDTFNGSGAKIRIPNSILSLGRVSPIKRVHILVEALSKLFYENVDFNADIVGGPVNQEDYAYVTNLEKSANLLIENNRLAFVPSVNQQGAAVVFQTHNIFVNLTPSGSMDKTILEACAAGCIPIVSNTFFKSIFHDQMIVQDSVEDLATKLKFWLNSSLEERVIWSKKLREYVVREHSVDILIKSLTRSISK